MPQPVGSVGWGSGVLCCPDAASVISRPCVPAPPPVVRDFKWSQHGMSSWSCPTDRGFFFLFLSVPATVVFTSVLGWKGLLLSPKGFKTFVPHKKSIWLDISAFPSRWSFSFRPVRLRAALSGSPPSSQFFLWALEEGLGRKLVNGSESPCICSQRFYAPMLACTWLVIC